MASWRRLSVATMTIFNKSQVLRGYWQILVWNNAGDLSWWLKIARVDNLHIKVIVYRHNNCLNLKVLKRSYLSPCWIRDKEMTLNKTHTQQNKGEFNSKELLHLHNPGQAHDQTLDDPKIQWRESVNPVPVHNHKRKRNRWFRYDMICHCIHTRKGMPILCQLVRHWSGSGSSPGNDVKSTGLCFSFFLSELLITFNGKQIIKKDTLWKNIPRRKLGESPSCRPVVV